MFTRAGDEIEAEATIRKVNISMNRRRFLTSSVAASVAAALAGRGIFVASVAADSSPIADVNAITGDGREVTLPMAAVEE